MDKYCKIFIAVDMPRESLISIIADKYDLEGSPFGSWSSGYFDMDIRINKDFNEQASKLFPDGFLHFEYYLDILFRQDLEDDEVMINMISDLLVWLWGNNYPAIAACDFENLLPEKGGYNSPHVPWPEPVTP
ncbi:1,4-dihydroxy-6-naphthoate synthase [Chitinophaga solisilvae]|uniref:1,4-dihydroxy-6-naphthoate synthase n=1 Tax=Chitinophaga solisilvae TaxID=1233460 RepID=UPI00136A2243|nr:1,4-dihydroxy-6-naphthoate synthase [Chitinophaga solisilvae]